MTRRVPPSPAQPRLAPPRCSQDYQKTSALISIIGGWRGITRIWVHQPVSIYHWCYRVMTSCIRYCSQDPAIAPSAKIPGYL